MYPARRAEGGGSFGGSDDGSAFINGVLIGFLKTVMCPWGEACFFVARSRGRGMVSLG